MAPGDYVLPGHVFRELRLAYLQTVARLVPEAMATLQALPPGDAAALHAWGARWRLGDPWVLEAARHHLETWRNDPAMAGRWWMVTTADWEPVPPAVIVAPWQEPRADVIARVAEVYDAAVAAASATPTPRKRHALRHLDWLVRYHVGGDTLEVIAAAAAAEPSPVSQAVHAMATLIGVRLS